jgi:hypothetical protein
MAFLLFAVLMVAFTRIGWWALERIEQPVNELSYWLGVVVTIVAAYPVIRLQEWYHTAGRPGQTQSASVQTKETPSQITLSATCAVIWIILTIIGIGVIIYIAFVILK